MPYDLEIDNRYGSGIHVFVDDVRIDTLRQPGKTSYPLAAGPHIVYCRIVGRISETLRVDARDGNAVALVCDLKGGRKKFLSGDGKTAEVIAPVRESSDWDVVAGMLLIIGIVFAALTVFSNLGLIQDFFLLVEALFVVFVFGVAGGGLYILSLRAKRPVRTAERAAKVKKP
jgi:hypothetical protein